MKRKKTIYPKISLGITLLALLVVAVSASFNTREKSAKASSESTVSHGHKDIAASCEDQVRNSGHEGEKEEGGSDLDRSVDEMWTVKCEHDILHYTCDECRYELGVVKLASALISENGNQGLVTQTTPESKSYSESLTLTGEVKLSERRTVHFSAPVPGIVRGVFTDVGKSVEKGEVIFEIDSNEIAEAKGEYMKKEAARDLAKKTAEREETLFKKKISAEAEVQQAQAKLSEAEVELANARTRLVRLGFSLAEISSLEGKNLDTISGLLSIRASQPGVIIERSIHVTENVQPGKDLFLLSDLSEVWVWADLRESDIPTIAKNTNGSGKIPAEVRSVATGTMIYRGTLDVLAGTMNEQTRTLKARIIIPNPEGLLRPGMFVNIRVLIPGNNSVLTVPKVAVLADGGRSFVFVHREGDYWIRRSVSIGKDFGEMVEVRDGLTHGQKIIADGSFLLKSDVLRAKMGAGCAD